MKRLHLLLIAVIGVHVASAQPTTPTSLRIGTFDSRAIAIAYAQSPAFGREMQLLREEANKAKAEKNGSLLKTLGDRGMTQQRLLHLQGFSTGSVTEILAKFPSDLAAVAQESGVAAIVSQYEVQFLSPSVTTVDVTEALVKKINDSPRVLQMLPELKNNKPISLLEAIAMPADQ